MVLTCQKHKSLHSEYIVKIPCGKLRKVQNSFQRVWVVTNRWKASLSAYPDNLWGYADAGKGYFERKAREMMIFSISLVPSYISMIFASR
jgi:hypothetical protein